MDTAKRASGLCHLPLEALQEVARHLADSHRPSLVAFSLTNKACYNASTLFVFRRIHINLNKPKDLQQDIDRLTETISRTNSARHIHSLTLRGFLDLEKPPGEPWGFGDVDYLGWWKHYCLKDEILPFQEPVWGGEYIVWYEELVERFSEEDLAWTPLVRFVKTIPLLEEMVYDCPNQFPPILLDALHQSQPRCKLHHMTFRLLSLAYDGWAYDQELALATSPCLHSIKVICCQRDSESMDDYNQEAAMQLSSLAPNLKHVTVIYMRPGRGLRSHRKRPPWQGFPEFSHGSVGTLTSLSLVGLSDWLLWPEHLRAWTKSTDFAVLRHLTLGQWNEHEANVDGDLLEFLALNCSFPQLASLRIQLHRGDGIREMPEYVNQAVAFFTALHPLEELSVMGPLEPKIFESILHRHGPRLRSLALRPWECKSSGYANRNRQEIPMIFTKEHVLQIQTQCPALEQLSIPVKRMQSGPAEVELYQSLAKIRRLKSLFIILDCYDWRVQRFGALSPSFDEHDLEDTGYNMVKGHLREALMNAAVDEALARSIWDIVRRGCKGLESLKLWTTTPDHFKWTVGKTYFMDLCRSWLFERVPRDDQEIFNIRELNRSAREAFNKEEIEKNRPQHDFEVEVFRRLWPCKEGSKSWRDDWSSLPLQI